MSKPKQAIKGVVFPADESGKRRSTPTTKAALGAMLAASTSPQGGDWAAQLAAQPSKQWRYGYKEHVLNAARVLATHDIQSAARACSAGLDAFYNQFSFVRNGETMSLAQAMDKVDQERRLHDVSIKGEGSVGAVWEVPLGEQMLSGHVLAEKAREWADNGAAEESFADSVLWFTQEERQLVEELGRDDAPVFVLLGATSEMGPMRRLLANGCTVVAVARPGQAKWERLISQARMSPGTLVVPVWKPELQGSADCELAKEAGCDCLVDTPEIAAWLVSMFPGRKLVIGGYIYLDGEAFVRASVAMDAVMRKVMEARGPQGCAVAFIDTPSHAHLVPRACATHADALWRARPLWHQALQKLPKLRALRRARFDVVDGCEADLLLASDLVVAAQGPNYAMAKWVSRWRCVVAQASEFTVSVNTGPPALTDSVMHADMVGKALLQLPHFPPNVYYHPTTVEAVLTALLMLDVLRPQKRDTHHMALFHQQAWHGGSWRCPYVADSLGVVAYLLHLGSTYGPGLAVAVGLTVGFVTVSWWNR